MPPCEPWYVYVALGLIPGVIALTLPGIILYIRALQLTAGVDASAWHITLAPRPAKVPEVKP